MSKLATTLNKEINKGIENIQHETDKATKKLDTNVSKAIGMPEGTKVGHAMNVDSAKHKEAVKSLKGETVSEQHDQSVNPTGEASDVSDNTEAC